jgi:hypothetical protein
VKRCVEGTDWTPAIHKALKKKAKIKAKAKARVLFAKGRW